MIKEIDELLEAWQNGNKDAEKLRELYSRITGIQAKKCGKCHSKWLTELQKYQFANRQVKPERKYILKPGNHSFAPGGPAVHNNSNTSDHEAMMYLRLYPHIRQFFIKVPE